MQLHDKYKENNKTLNRLIQDSKKASTDTDYVTFQIKEIEDLNLKPNEKETIQAELEILNNVEEIKSALDYSSSKLLNNEENTLVELKRVANSIEKISNCSDNYKVIYNRIESVIIELEDIANDMEIGRASGRERV